MNKTLDREKSKKLFEEIKLIAGRVSMLSATIQNPDFVDKTNAEENYNMFCIDYENCIKSLERVKEEICKLHDEFIWYKK